MNSFSNIPTAPVLTPFIRCFSIRHITKKGLYSIKPVHALHELCLVFCLTEHGLPASAEGQSLLRPYYITGLSTTCHGTIYLNEPGNLFYIHFTPNGFYKLFLLSPKAFVNKTLDAITFLGKPLQVLGDALKNCGDKEQMKTIANDFLLQLMSKQTATDLFDGITAASNIILNNITINTAQLASYVNMSLRNFERRFQEQVGIPAKLYCRIVRFTNALRLKINSTETGWSSIAQACGYFDQMHLIKDFHQFTGCSPSLFFKGQLMMEEKNGSFFIN